MVYDKPFASVTTGSFKAWSQPSIQGWRRASLWQAFPSSFLNRGPPAQYTFLAHKDARQITFPILLLKIKQIHLSLFGLCDWMGFFDLLGLWKCARVFVNDMSTLGVFVCVYFRHVQHAAPTPPSAAFLCISQTQGYNKSSVPQRTYCEMFTCVSTSTHTHTGVYCIFNTPQVHLCHLRFALENDTNSRVIQTVKLLWRGLFLVVSLPLLSFLFLLSPPLKGIEGLCALQNQKGKQLSITLLYFFQT